ncbi:MAG: methyl-accepting chemotaxis protein [Sulfuriferula sp.]
MRANMPVTQCEFAFPADKTLVSVTDLKGRITYCNEVFAIVSGYTSEELLGQPHNIIRHPDMPEEAFRDLWATVQSGVPWSGVVKNRRKNGDHYWVQANATPMMNGDSITGFLSVRTPPTSEAVAGAERLYARMSEEARSGRKTLTLLHGQLIRHDWLGRLQQALTPNLRSQLLGIQLLAVGMAALAVQAEISVALTVLAVFLAAAAATWTTLMLTVKPLQSVVIDANRLASGDLSYPITTGAKGLAGNLQQALIQLSVNLRTVVHDVRAEIERLRDSVREIAAGNMDMSSRTESQASSLEQTAASMEQINSTVKHSADSAQRGAKLALDTGIITLQGNQAVQAVAETMESITDSSQRIGEIIQVIEGVAFQTNILALNAAVEAARAGEAGRGFAVVASEVRSLAQRTTGAAHEIRQLITESVERVNAGNVRTRDARERMQEVLQAVDNVSVLLDEISTATSEQRSGISQVTEAIAQMDSITQQNASMVEQLAAAAQSLLGQVAGVSNSMGIFRLTSGETTIAERDAVQLRRVAQALPSNKGGFDNNKAIHPRTMDRHAAIHRDSIQTLRPGKVHRSNTQ